MAKVEVQAKGIRNRLKSFKPYRAISEYIWNGFDAGANTICIDYVENELGTINELYVSDNGAGIPFDLVDKKFKPVLSSEKRDLEVQHSLIHGKNGLGRLTFFHFAQKAGWSTCYEEDGKKHRYDISVDSDHIDDYDPSEIKLAPADNTGASVAFYNIYGISSAYIENDLVRFLEKEFSWFLELNKDLGFSIRINGSELSYGNVIKDKEDFTVYIGEYVFDVRFIRWSHKLNRHFSRYYCKDINGVFKYSKPTTLNNKSDEFYHSVFISSKYFDSFVSGIKPGTIDAVSPNNDQAEEFRELILKVNEFLRNKRKPFIVDHARKLTEEFESQGYFPEFNSKNRWEQMRHDDLKETITQLYQVEPRIFANLNVIQKKTFISFIALAIDSGEVGDLFEILGGVLELSSGERERFARQLKTTKMSSIVSTIELISDRYKSVAEFKRLVFDPKMYAGEVPHLQKMTERNYWLIGEEYLLLTAAEPKFEEALRRYTHLLQGTAKEKEIEHDDRNREMDLFLVRQRKNQNKIENVILELKHPVNVRLGKKESDQIYSYYQVIKSEPEFNASNMEWKFYLIGNDFDSTGYISSQISSLKSHGEPGLIFSGEYKVYAFKWSEIFCEFELKHEFLNKNLKLELERLSEGEHESADDIVNKTRTSDAAAEYAVA